MRYSAQSAGTGSQAGGRVSCAARFIAFGRRALQAAAGVWRAAQAAQVRAAGVDAAAAQAAQDERAAFGRISERAAIHAAIHAAARVTYRNPSTAPAVLAKLRAARVSG